MLAPFAAQAIMGGCVGGLIGMGAGLIAYWSGHPLF